MKLQEVDQAVMLKKRRTLVTSAIHAIRLGRLHASVEIDGGTELLSDIMERAMVSEAMTTALDAKLAQVNDGLRSLGVVLPEDEEQ